MLYTGNPVILSPGMVLALYAYDLQWIAIIKLAMNLGETYD